MPQAHNQGLRPARKAGRSKPCPLAKGIKGEKSGVAASRGCSGETRRRAWRFCKEEPAGGAEDGLVKAHHVGSQKIFLGVK